MKKFKYTTIPAHVSAWFTGTSGYRGGHPQYGNRQLTVQQIKTSPAEFKDKLFNNIKSMYERDSAYADKIDQLYNEHSGIIESTPQSSQFNVSVESGHNNKEFTWSVIVNGEEYDGHYTITRDERSPDEIEWNQGDVPDNWDEVEAAIENAVSDYMYNRHKTHNEVKSMSVVKKKRLSLLSLYERSGAMFEKEYEYSKEERDAFIEAVRNYETYGQVIRRSEQLKDAIQEISELVNLATDITLKETDGWFDNVTTSRHGKQMKEAVKVLQKEAQEIIQRQQRLEAAYEDIGQLLGRYYDV